MSDKKTLDDIRREYLQGGLSESNLNVDPIKQFDIWLQQAIQAKLFADPTAMNLATVDEQNRPSQRTVLLKKVNDDGFVFFTNLGSHKAKDIETNPNVNLHFAWLPLERQISIQGTAHKLSLTDNAKYFLSRPRDSQLAAWTSRQSKGIGSRKMLDMAFEQIKNKFKNNEIPVPDFWGGYLVKPERIEFWQGGAKRLHDRFEYQLKDGVWQLNRLQP
ncbi:MAG: pyridoxamine 5'-phosphate oxidase [Saccharospirillaceae bacterium]|nr:pyridoxamine 5'-phosphate oxidase [Pseudomonadales bacterium]NRB81079.1 pyridoxamine 5'-phosphate oxidase [Saccharospirillaceae bacterium]